MKFLESCGAITHIKLNQFEFCLLSDSPKFVEKTTTHAIIKLAGAKYKLPLSDVEPFSNYTVSDSDFPLVSGQIPGSIRIISAAEAMLLWLRNAQTF